MTIEANESHISIGTANLLKSTDYEWKPYRYSRQEILREYNREFFAKNIHTVKILYLLQKAKYKEADLYLRKYCILIDKNKKNE